MSLEAQHPHQPPSELITYLSLHPEVDPARVTLALHVPALIGGPKSGQFEVRDAEATPDAPPDPTATIDLRMVAVSRAGMRDFADWFSANEARADAQYPLALLATQQQLAEERASGSVADTLLVPDTVNSSASGYFRRLGRLAQDIDMRVAIQVASRYDNEPYFKHIDPPRATRVAAYWAAREIDHPPYIHAWDRPKPTAAEAFTALLQLTAQPGWEEHTAGQALAYNLALAANAEVDHLRTWLTQPEGMARHILPVVQELAYGQTYVRDYNRARARVIAAKIDDPNGLAVLQHELRTRTGGFGSSTELMHPLGIYLQHHPELKTAYMQQVEAAITSDKRLPEDITHILGALLHSADAEAGAFVTQYITPESLRTYPHAREVLQAAQRWLEMYVVQLDKQPPSPQQQATRLLIEQRCTALLEAMTNGQLGKRAETAFVDGRSPIADILLLRVRAEHREVLRRHLIKLFHDTGSVLPPAHSDDNGGFIRQYLRYRRYFGDIEEISRRINIEPQARSDHYRA